MRNASGFAAIILLAGSIGYAQQPANLVADVRAAATKQDFAEGDRLIAAHRAAQGVTSEMLEALSWLGRGAFAANNLDKAEAYAQQTYDLTLAALKGRGVDDDRRLATALGASIEVLAQSGAKRGIRSEAVAFLQQELTRWGESSIARRIQKNLNLLSLEGVPAPALDLSDHVGPQPQSLDALKGKVVVLFFWAHWCGDCKAQAPILATLLERYRDRGLVVVGPTQRYGYTKRGTTAAPDAEKRYIDETRLSSYGQIIGMPVPIAASNHDRYGVSTTPTLVVLDRQGLVRLYNPGRMTEEALEPILLRLLGDDR